MYNGGLTDKELITLHKKFKLNLNMFLNDILTSDLFKINDKESYYEIIPLFYCDKIETDGDAIINETYKITCKKDYSNIFLFISETTLGKNKMYTIKEYGDEYLIFIYYLNTLEPCRNTVFEILENDSTQQYLTDKYGYCVFSTETDDFEVVL